MKGQVIDRTIDNGRVVSSFDNVQYTIHRGLYISD